MSDKIAEIRAQHELTDRWRGTPYLLYPKMHEDRATLLGEVERLTRERGEARAEVERLRAALRFYADPFKHTDINGDDVIVPDFYSETDFGETARIALGEEG